jgi:hypothetical protein
VVVPRSLPSLAFTGAVIGGALAAGFGGSWVPSPARAAPKKVTYEIYSTASSASIDLHHVAWRRVVVPGRVCGVRGSLRLRNGKAVINRHLEVDANWHPVVFGDLDADGSDEAALSVECSNRSGTADGALAYAIVVFTGGTSAPTPLAIIRPQHQRARMLPTLIQVAIRPRRINGREAFYGPKDGTCCPSGRAVDTWKYVRGRVKLTATRVTREPS